jgi:hypothetical protein
MVGTAKYCKRRSRSVLQRAALSRSTCFQASVAAGFKRLIFHPTARCPVFDLYDYKDPANKCFQSPAINEKTTGTLPALPGCNPIVRNRRALRSLRDVR